MKKVCYSTLATLTLATTMWSALPSAGAAAQEGSLDVIVFTDADTVRGELVRPGGEVLRVRQGHGRRSLIRPRAGFVVELLKAVEDI